MSTDPTSTEEAVELFLELRRRGERVDPREFLARNAHVGPDLASALEALIALESAASAPAPVGHDLPERVGPYRVLRELGRGGMGLVLEAVEEPLGRSVALKLLPSTMLANPAARARFQREAQLAARLDHPAIATVYGTGVEDSQPWIAMRLVEGITLARAIAEARAAGAGCVSLPGAGSGPRNALRALTACAAQLARALQAAHEQGVVHRDVKPSNVIVTAEGKPVLVDFGLAIDEDPGSAALTRSGDTAGTPAYTAPEIIAGEQARHDARGDVYALGVTLYECLTLRRPFEGPTPAALYGAILGESPVAVRALNRQVPRDLAVVVTTAMERDRSRRYASAAALADDLERCLRGEPIRARPPSAGYRLRRFVGRNRGLSVAAALILLLLLAGLVAALLARGRALDLLERAELAESAASRRADQLAAELETNRAMRELQASWLRVEDLDVAGRDVRLADVLDRAAASLDERAGLDARVEAELRAALASAYHSLTLWPESIEQAQRAREAAERGGALDPDRASELERRACVATALGGGKAGALERARRLHEESAQRAGSDELDATLWRVTLGEMLIHNLLYAEAEGELRAAVASLLRIGPEQRPELLDARMLLVRALRRQGRVAQAESEVVGLVADCERLLGAEHFTTMLALGEQAGVLLLQGRFEDALAVQERRLASFERRFGAGSEATLGVVSDMAGIVRELGDPRRAEQLARRAAEETRRLRGLEHPLAEARWGRWGNALIAVGRVDEGLAKLAEALAARSARLGPDDPDTLEVQLALGNALYRAERFERSHEVLRVAYPAHVRRLGPEHRATLSCQNSLGMALLGLGREAEAVEMLRGIHDLRAAQLDRLDPDLLASLANLATATAQAGQAEESGRLFDELLERNLARHGPDRPQTWTLAEPHIATLIAAGRAQDAGALTERTLAFAREHSRTPPERVCGLLTLRARAALAAGAPELARASNLEALAFAAEHLPESSKTRADVERSCARFFAEQGDPARGVALFESALARLGGAAAAPTALLVELAAACEAAGLEQRAAELRERAAQRSATGN
ncbi:MAG: protein kinase [Planctomycetes bacterium]|nr:protein kinase [Planctomycetota bacterium]